MKMMLGPVFALAGAGSAAYYGYFVDPGKFVVASFVALMGLVAAYDFYRARA